MVAAVETGVKNALNLFLFVRYFTLMGLKSIVYRYRVSSLFLLLVLYA